jgi:hypothetical protein
MFTWKNLLLRWSRSRGPGLFGQDLALVLLGALVALPHPSIERAAMASAFFGFKSVFYRVSRLNIQSFDLRIVKLVQYLLAKSFHISGQQAYNPVLNY